MSIDLKEAFQVLADTVAELFDETMAILSNRELLIVIILLAVCFILTRLLKVSSNVDLALMDDKVVVKRKDPYLDDKINYLYQNLRVPPFPVYVISKQLKKTLYRNRFGQPSIEMLVHDILERLEVPVDNLEVIVDDESISRFEGKSTAGLYVETAGGLKREIHIALKPGYSLNEVVAIICHECTHAYLNYHNVKLDDVRENEVLTDTGAMYLGFSQYLLAGYKPVKRIAGVTYNADIKSTKIQSSTIGYLNLSQLAYISKALAKLNRRLRRLQRRPRGGGK